MNDHANLRMMFAINAQDFFAFMGALDDGADVNYIAPVDDPDFFDYDQDTTPLIEAMRIPCADIFNFLVSHPSIDVNLQNAHGTSPVMLAAASGHQDRVEQLIERGGDLLAADEYGHDTLRYAELGRQARIIPWLTEQVENARRSKPPGFTPKPWVWRGFVV